MTFLEQELEYEFKDKKLLQTALTHTSYANENNVISNEKLEFLGDSILEFLSSEYIYKNYFHLKEGEMSKVRASVVCEESLNEIGKKHKFDDYIYLGKSEKTVRTDVRPAILADSVEAVIAAMFLDGGIEPAKRFIEKNLKEKIEFATHHIGQKDYKTVLQELLQKKGSVKIEYDIFKEIGPDHDKIFYAKVICNEEVLATGKGKSKKLAETNAAKNALVYIDKR